MRGLREGLTTGTTATAAAMAAMCLAVTGILPARVRVPLPPFFGEPVACASSWRSVGIHMGAKLPAGEIKCPEQYGQPLAHAAAVKDGGDDPDATNGAIVCASLFRRTQESSPEFVRIHGSSGIGTVTLPGLGLEVGEAAINPVPRQQILFALTWLHRRIHKLEPGQKPFFCLVLSVPDGEIIAKNTLNARLGIMGGISILGTHGIVRPFSNEAWADATRQAIDVAWASGQRILCLGTGRRSEYYLMGLYPHLPEACFVQAGDFVAQSLEWAGQKNFAQVIWGCFFGKLLKLARGLGNTHAMHGLPDMHWLADVCAAQGIAQVEQIARAPTARAALELILAAPQGKKALDALVALASEKAGAFAGRPVLIHLFHSDGRELASR